MAAPKKHRYPVTSFLGIFLGIFLGLFASGSAYAMELTVQIGAFGDRPKPAFAEQAAQYGELLVLRGDDGITRVSIGRYDNKAAARAALQQLQIAGYPDAYIANVTGRGTEVAVSGSELPVTFNGSPTQTAEAEPAPRIATTPEGRPIVTPKQADAEGEVAQAGRFRLRTHDTQSGETSDVRLVNNSVPPSASGAVVTGLGANEIPQHLRDKLVYLDGVPHIKDGESFIPLNDAVDGK